MMVEHGGLSDAELWKRIRSKELVFGGNSRLKIYGTLVCKSGKRMKRENRVFFSSEKEALQHNYRPCGHCMRKEYNAWIYLSKQ
ncbi:MAG TPA: Ada metal-binding domain-containing protein [Algoriphagus sp.]|nr:Ada metal-binding domain-containing protein [Algoriphagus sp.]